MRRPTDLLRRPPRLLRAAAVVAGVVSLLAVAGAQVPQLPPPLCGEPPLPACEDPEPSPSPTGEPSPTGSPQVPPGGEASPQPSPEPSPSAPPTPTPTPRPGIGEPPGVQVGDDPVEPPSGRQPDVAPPRGGAGTTGGGGTPTVRLVGVDAVAAALPGGFAIALLGTLMGVAALVGTRGLLRRGVLTVVAEDGGIDVERTHRTRMIAGVVLLAAAAVVGIIGYLKISLETQVPVQIVYLASAGFGVVVLAVAGGSLIVSDQLRADERRIQQVELAVASLAEHLRSDLQAPPRLLDRNGSALDAAAGDGADADQPGP